MSFLDALFGAKDKPSGRRSFLKRSAATGAALAVAPLAIGGQEGRTEPGLAVTDDVPEPAPIFGSDEWVDKFERDCAEAAPAKWTRGVMYLGGGHSWPIVSPELAVQRQEQHRAQAQSRKRDARGGFAK